MSNYLDGLKLNPIDTSYSSLADNSLSFSNIGGTASTTQQSGQILDSLNQAKTDYINSALADKNSMWGAGGKFDTFAGNAGKVIGGISSLANIYLGFQQLNMAKQELGIKKDQWAMAKGELKHMQATRKRIGQSYTGGAAVPR